MNLLITSKFLRSQRCLQEVVQDSKPCRIQTVNLDHLRLAAENDRFRRALLQADYLTADGWPVVALMRRRGLSIERATGSQLLLDITKDPRLVGRRWALYGGSRDVGERFSSILADSGQELVLHEHGAKDGWDPTVESRRCSHSGATAVLIAVGQPHGEIFGSDLARCAENLLVIGVGGAVEMLLGAQVRVPGLAKKVGAEWLFRLVYSPGRLFKRYIIKDLPFFFYYVVPRLLVKDLHD